MRLQTKLTLVGAVATLVITTACSGSLSPSSFRALPTAPPTPTPTPAPLTATPTALSLSGIGATFAQTTQVQEAAYTGTFTENDTCSGIATVTTVNGAGPSATFTVTGAGAGTCTVTIGDTHAQHVAINVTVSTVSIGVQSHRKNP